MDTYIISFTNEDSTNQLITLRGITENVAVALTTGLSGSPLFSDVTLTAETHMSQDIPAETWNTLLESALSQRVEPLEQ